MTVEKSADLLRQRADHNVQHSREIEKLNARFQDEKASMQRRVDDADSARQQEAMQRQQAEMPDLSDLSHLTSALLPWLNKLWRQRSSAGRGHGVFMYVIAYRDQTVLKSVGP